MANKVRFDYSKASKFINAHEVEYMSELAVAAREKLVSKSGAGNDFLGWIDLPVDYDKEEFARIPEAAAKMGSSRGIQFFANFCNGMVSSHISCSRYLLFLCTCPQHQAQEHNNN